METMPVAAPEAGTASANCGGQRRVDSLAHKRQLIESALDGYTQFSADCPDRLREAIRYMLLVPGKRLRPILVMLAAEACGGTADAALPGACAVELVHTYSLIHDDLPAMDDDDSRRGRPTCHKKFGEPTALLAGDALLALAFEVLTRDVQPGEVAAACCATLAQACGAQALAGGQCDDVSLQLDSGSLELLELIHNRKTGALFLASLRIGGLTAGATDEQHEALRGFGQNLGLAFQITDDLIDYHENSRTPATTRRQHDDSHKLTFPNLLGVEASRKRVQGLVREATKSLEPLGAHARSLRALAEFISDRV